MYWFDTFCDSSLIIEAEDYDFAGGKFFQAPVAVRLDAAPFANAYALRKGAVGVDYVCSNPNRVPAEYRPEDSVPAKRSLDHRRQKYSDDVFDYDVYALESGDFLSYTRFFPDLEYSVYLRRSVFDVPEARTALELVNPPNGGIENIATLGYFRSSATGLDYENVPLSDAEGRVVRVKLSGVCTIRLRQTSQRPINGVIADNYLVFASDVSACIEVESAPGASGPYLRENRAAISGNTVSIPTSESGRFFRVVAERASEITNIRSSQGAVLFDFVLR